MIRSMLRTCSVAFLLLVAAGSRTAQSDDLKADSKPTHSTSLSVKDFGAQGDWDSSKQSGSDDTAAFQAAIDHAATHDSSSKVVSIPPGEYTISRTIYLPNLVRLEGDNGRNTTIHADHRFRDPYMFHAGNGTTSMFHSRLENLTISAESNPSIQAVVKADAWQEGCGLRDVLLHKFNKYGLELDHGYGGSSMLRIEDCEFFAGPNAERSSAGIYVHEVSSVAAFLLRVENCSICGGSPTKKLGCGILMENDTLVGSAIHFEWVTEGIRLQRRANASLDAVTGSFPVPPDDPRYQATDGAAQRSTLVVLEKDWSGFLSGRALMPNGFEVTIQNERSGENTTGTLPEVNISALE